jgi:hypothetical protein
MIPSYRSYRALLLTTAWLILGQLSDASGDEVIMLRDVFVSTVGNASSQSRNAQGAIRHTPIHLLNNEHFTLISETNQHVIISTTLEGKTLNITIPRQDVRIQRVHVPTPVPSHLLTTLRNHLETANQQRAITYNKLGQYRRKHRNITEALELKTHIALAHAQLSVDIAEIVLAYQSLRDNALDNSRSSEILHEELRTTLDSLHEQDNDVVTVSQNLAPLQRTASQLDRLGIELAKLDKLLAGRRDKSILLANRDSSPFVLNNLQNVINNVVNITRRYETLADDIDNLPHKHSGIRSATVTMTKIEQQQIDLSTKLKNLHSKLSVLQDITRIKAAPTTTVP